MAITLKLEINGKEKIFVAPAPKARLIRKSIELQSIKQDAFTAENLDEMLGFVTEIFNRQFTIDDMYDGIYADKLMSEIMRVINEMTSGLSADPNVPTAK